MHQLVLGMELLRGWGHVSRVVEEGGSSDRARATLDVDGTNKHAKNNHKFEK